MRLIKLSKEEFSTPEKLKEFFEKELFSPSRKGLFRFTKGRMKNNGLTAGEMLLFCYQSNICYRGEAQNGVKKNTYKPEDGYPFCIIVKEEAFSDIVPNIALKDLEELLRKKTGFQKSLRGRGWTIINDPKDEAVVKELLFAAKDAA